VKYYAGIGSRETPYHICKMMTAIAKRLSSLDYICRSGGADGADDAFEIGAEYKQIFLPWDGFNGRTANGTSYIVPSYIEEYVFKYHPKPDRLSAAGKKLMSRNTYQILGSDLNTPVEFVLCWTKDGLASGGTGQAIRIAKDRKIPIFNLKTDVEKFSVYMSQTIMLTS
jgi:hypothetical protein